MKIQRLVFLLIPIIALMFLIASVTASTNKPVNRLTVAKQHQTFNTEADNQYALELTRTLQHNDASQLAVEFKLSLGDNKLTKSVLYSDEEAIGNIYFSAVKR